LVSISIGIDERKQCAIELVRVGVHAMAPTHENQTSINATMSRFATVIDNLSS